MKALMRALTRVYLAGLFEVEGAENVPLQGPVLLCPNHFGTLDPPLVPAFLPRPDCWSMAKAEWFRTRFSNWFFRSYQAFPVIRHTADRVALRRSFEILKAGHALVLYPEGTRIDAGALATPEPGAGFIAQRARCAVVPVALTGTRAVLPPGARWPRRSRVSMRFGKPFRVAQHRPSGERISFQDAVDAIMLQVAEMLPPEKRGRYSDVEAWRSRLEGVVQAAE
jgi:1-acyl-sn-glycerol-3-phosphate acyltransferase